MTKIKYKKYSKNKMLRIIQTEGFIFVETNRDDYFIIRIQDIPDFIMLESIRTGYSANISMYIPGIDSPVLTTYGCYLNKINTSLREEIINKLILLQTKKIKPKKVKIFDNDRFNALSETEKGIEDGKIKNFDKFYQKYVYAQEIWNNR